MSLSGEERRRPRSPIIDFTFLLIIFAAFSVVLYRLYSVQVVQGEDFARRSRDNFVQSRRIEHDRGEIVDRHGRILVANRPTFNVFVTPAFLPRLESSIDHLASLTGLSNDAAEEVTVAVATAQETNQAPILLARGLSRSRAEVLRAAQAEADIPLLALVLVESENPEEIDVFIDPSHFPSEAMTLGRVRQILELDDKSFATLTGRVENARGLVRYKDILVRHDVRPAAQERIRSEIELGMLPGVTIREGRARDYRRGQRAAHLLGYVNEISGEELVEKRSLGYRLGDRIGRRGVERTYEDELRGVDGTEYVIVDSKGRRQASRFAKDLIEEIGEREEPRAGNRVVLSIDLDLQEVAEDEFKGRAGSVVAMEVKTGRILAITSTPTFDPNLVSGYFDPKEKKRLDAMKDLKPWRFRAIQDHHAPGSTFKVVTALAGLVDGVVTPEEQINCPGAFRLGDTRFRCWKESGHGLVNTKLAIARSCDVYFYTLGSRLGLDPIANMALSLGFGAKTGIPIEGESPGIAPTEAWFKKRFGYYTRGAAVNASIGQGAVVVSTLQLAVAYATVANGGTVYEPQVALRIEAYDGSAVVEFDPVVRRKLSIPQGILDSVHEGLRAVVNEPYGTAYWRRLKEVEVAGKTGTAQVAKMGARVRSRDLPWELGDHAWFVGYAPSSAPEIVVAVFNEHGGHGGSASAPTAMAVIKAWWEKRQATAGPLEVTAPELTLSEGPHTTATSSRGATQ